MGTNAVGDSDLEIRGGGGGGALKTKLPMRSIKLPQPCGPRLLSKNKVGLAPGPLRPKPLSCICHCNVVTSTDKLQIMIVYL